MGIKGGHRNNNYGFGNLTNLKPVIPAVVAAEEDTNTNTDQKIMQISLHSFQLLQNHSIEYHTAEDQPISYDQCIQELCNFWNLEHGQKHIHFVGTRN